VVGKAVTGNTVLINSAGQLGVLVSSARYKQDIQPLGDQSAKVEQLRPVTFHYKQEPKGPVQYGLIAEEVATVYPELVTRDAKGTIEGVRYEELTPLLLTALQHQQQEIATLKAALVEQNAAFKAALVEQNAALAARVEQLEAAHMATVASR
jgi:hypothetical protein